MRLDNLILISWQNVLRFKRRVLLSSLGIVFGLATLILFLALADGVRFSSPPIS